MGNWLSTTPPLGERTLWVMAQLSASPTAAASVSAVEPARPTTPARHSLRQNAIAMFLGQGITWGLTAVTLALVPRYLGPGQMGAMGIGMSFSTLGTTIAGIGMATLITREIARDRERARDLLATAVWLHLVFGALAAVVAIGAGFLMGYESLTRVSIIAQASTVPLNLMILLGFGALQGVEVMRHQAIWDATIKLLSLLALGVIIVLDLGFYALMVLSVASALLGAIPGVVLMRRYLPFRLLSFSLAQARYLVLESIPFCAINVFVVAYLAVDTLLLSVLAGEMAVGIYTAPSRIFGTLLFAPTIITTVVFPRMAASFRSEPHALERLARETIRIVVAITFPVAVLAVGTSGALLVTLIGDGFTQSGPVIALLAVSLVPTGLNMVAHRILTAADRQRLWTVVMVVGLVAKIALDLALIPLAERLWGNPALGAAIGLVLVEAGMMITAFVALPRGIFRRAEAWNYGRLLLTGAGAATTMFLLQDAHFLVLAMAGGAVYLTLAALLRVYTLDDLRDALDWGLGRQVATVSPSPSEYVDHSMSTVGRLKPVRPARPRK